MPVVQQTVSSNQNTQPATNTGKVTFQTTNNSQNVTPQVTSVAPKTSNLSENNENKQIPQNFGTTKIAQNQNLSLNQTKKNTVTLNAGTQKIITIQNVNNIEKNNDQVTVYTNNNGQVHQFDKNLNMTTGPTDQTILKNDGKNAIYISNGQPYQAIAYPKEYTKLSRDQYGFVLQNIPTQSVNTFTQNGKEVYNFPGAGTTQYVSNYKVNSDNSVTVTLSNGNQQLLKNNWVKPIGDIATSLNSNQGSNKSGTSENGTNNQNSSDNGNGVLETGKNYQVIHKENSIVITYKSKQIAVYDDISYLQTNNNSGSSAITFNCNNNTNVITIGKPFIISKKNFLPVDDTFTEQGLVNKNKENPNVVYLGNGSAFSPNRNSGKYQEIIKLSNGSYEIGEHIDSNLQGFQNGIKMLSNNGMMGSMQIKNVKVNSDGSVTYEDTTGKSHTLTNNWLQNSSSNNSQNKPSNTTPNKPVSGNTPAGTTNNKPAGSTPASSNNKPASSNTPAGTTTENKPATNNTPASSNNKPASSNTPAGTTTENKPATNNTPASSNNKPASSNTPANSNNKTADNNHTPAGIATNKPASVDGNNKPVISTEPATQSKTPEDSDSNNKDEKGSSAMKGGNSTTPGQVAPNSGSAPNNQAKPADNNSNSSQTQSSSDKTNTSADSASSNTTQVSDDQSTSSNNSSASDSKSNNVSNDQSQADQAQSQSQNGSKTTVSDNGDVKTETTSNSGTADSIADFEKKTGLSADQVKKMLAEAEANGGHAQFQNEQQHVYHVGQQGQAVAEPAGSAVSAPVEETASAPAASVASAPASVSVLGSAAPAGSSSSSSASSSNALPETGMANEGIEFAVVALAMAGFSMLKREDKE